MARSENEMMTRMQAHLRDALLAGVSLLKKAVRVDAAMIVGTRRSRATSTYHQWIYSFKSM
jgi:hypothetical protein